MKKIKVPKFWITFSKKKHCLFDTFLKNIILKNSFYESFRLERTVSNYISYLLLMRLASAPPRSHHLNKFTFVVIWGHLIN
jgi:hypothetical protein